MDKSVRDVKPRRCAWPASRAAVLLVTVCQEVGSGCHAPCNMYLFIMIIITLTHTGQEGGGGLRRRLSPGTLLRAALKVALNLRLNYLSWSGICIVSRGWLARRLGDEAD